MVREELRFGQIHAVLFLLCVLLWIDLRGERDARAGLWLGIAIAFKLFPAFLALLLLGMRRFRVVKWAALSSISVLLASWIATGMHVEFFHRVAEVGSVWRLFGMNISWQGVLYRNVANAWPLA